MRFIYAVFIVRIHICGFCKRLFMHFAIIPNDERKQGVVTILNTVCLRCINILIYNSQCNSELYQYKVLLNQRSVNGANLAPLMLFNYWLPSNKNNRHNTK